MNETRPMSALLACRIPATSKKQVLQSLSESIAAQAGLCERAVCSALMTREKLGSTATGQGIALPHATLEGTGQPITMVATLDSQVDFDAPDGAPVDLICLVLGRESDQANYLAAIRNAASLIDSHAMALRAAQDTASMQQVILPANDAAA